MTDWPVKDPLGREIHLPSMEKIEVSWDRVDKLLLLVAPFMTEDDDEEESLDMTPEEWVSECFLSDLSKLGDFMLDEKQLMKLSTQVGFPVSGDDFIFDVAARMSK